MKSSIVITFLLSAVVARNHRGHKHKSYHHTHLMEILKSKYNFFGEVNNKIQSVMNNLFEPMELSEQFTNEPKIKLLLTMHYDLNNIAEKNYEIYDVLRNVSAVEPIDKNVDKIGLYDYVKETLNEKQFNAYRKLKDKSIERIQKSRTTKRMLPGFKDSQEFKEFIGGFIRKVNSLTPNKLFPNNNLKVWEPPKETNYSFSLGTRRIYRGTRTNIKKYPFVVSVHIMGEFMCAGSIISRDLILTAASCVQIHYNNRFFRENPKTTYIRLGSDWTSRRGEVIGVLEIYFYPAYDPKRLRNNIAILRLRRALRFRRKSKVKRIQLDTGNGNLPCNTNEVLILGWGSKTPSQVVDPYEKLNLAALQIYPVDDCARIYTKQYVTDTNFCAGFISKGSGACNRDVGGPGIVGGLLVGVVSFGSPSCGTKNAPTVFTRVGPYINWIETIIEMRVPNAGAPTTTFKPAQKILQFLQSITTRQWTTRLPLFTLAIAPIVMPTFRAHEDDVHETTTNPEEMILKEILTDISDKNNSIIHDLIKEDLNNEFYDTYVPNIQNGSLANNPLINSSLFLMPGLAKNVPLTTTAPTTTMFSTYNDVTSAYTAINNTDEEYTYNDYEPTEAPKANKYTPSLSELSREEYFEKHKKDRDVFEYDDDEDVDIENIAESNNVNVVQPPIVVDSIVD